MNIDLNVIVVVFDTYLENAVKNMTRRKIKKNCNINQFNEEVRRLKRVKIDKHHIAKIEYSSEAWAIYKAMGNLYKVNIKNAKNNYINNKINNATDKKEMWELIKNLIFRKSRSAIETVIFDQVECKDNFDIVDNFNKYFINSIKTIRDEINNVQHVNR